MRIDASDTKRVRHDVADGIALMAFSLAASIAIALLVRLALVAS